MLRLNQSRLWTTYKLVQQLKNPDHQGILKKLREGKELAERPRQPIQGKIELIGDSEDMEKVRKLLKNWAKTTEIRGPQ
jgi:hypothetical protein